MVAAFIYLISQSVDIDIDDIAVEIKIHIIDMLGKFCPAYDPVLVQGQIFEDGIFLGRE